MQIDKKSCKAKLKELVTEEAQDDHVQTTNSTAKRSLPEEESYQQQFSQALKLMKEEFDRKLKQTTIDLRAEFNAKLAEMRKAQQREILAISKAADAENRGTNSQFVCSSSGIALNPSDVIQAIAQWGYNQMAFAKLIHDTWGWEHFEGKIWSDLDKTLQAQTEELMGEF